MSGFIGHSGPDQVHLCLCECSLAVLRTTSLADSATVALGPSILPGPPSPTSYRT